MRTSRYIPLLVALASACTFDPDGLHGGADARAPDPAPDAAFALPDAAPWSPDAAPRDPDATPGSPDPMAPNPDAAASWPDAAGSLPADAAPTPADGGAAPPDAGGDECGPCGPLEMCCDDGTCALIAVGCVLR